MWSRCCILSANPKADAATPLQLPWPTGGQHRISGGYTYGCGTHSTATASGPTAYNADYFAIDFQFALNDNVTAIAAGNVIYRDDAGDGYGNKVVVDHGGGYYSVYAHLNGFAVNQSERVAQGRMIGYAGGSGGYPVHLHMHEMLNLAAYRPEPMSGLGGFGWYGYSTESGLSPPSKGCSDSGTGCTPSTCGNIHDPSPYWKSLPSFDRDFGSDTCSDVMARSGDLLKIYAGDCYHGFPANYQIGSGFLYFSKLLQTGDFNGDRCIDMLGADSGGLMYLYRGNCAGGWLGGGAGIQVGSGWNAYLDVSGPGDFDGDGCNDVIGRNAACTTLYLWRGNCGSSGVYWKDGGTATVIGSGWNIMDKVWSSGDFDADGCLDVMTRDNPSVGAIYLYRGNCGNGGVYWRNNGAAIQVGSGFTQTSELIGPGDFNRYQYESLRCMDLIRKTFTANVYLYIGACGAAGWFGNNEQAIATGGSFGGTTMVP